jgi:ADP-ribose pyrophosphatase YjhB (NUDIX family)
LPHRIVVTKLLQRYWRLSRGLTMGAQGVVIDEHDRVLLIRHTYMPGWRFPGGGVERGETVEHALARELDEEAGVVITGKAELHGLYANFRRFPNDHIALFVVRQWRQVRTPQPNYEIAEHGMFARDALPADINPSTARRLEEVFGGAPRDQMW